MARRKRKPQIKKIEFVDPVKKPHEQHAYTQEQIEELRKCSEDVFYFIENYVYVVDISAGGSVLFKPFEYQKELIQNFIDHRNTIAMLSRQMGKSTCAAAYMLWLSMFKSEQTILVVSNVFSAALEIMDRIRFSYEMLPNWLKPGVAAYNKGSIYFDNKSRIISRATTKNSARGLSLSLLYCDEFSAVDLNKQREFWSAIRPTLSTGGRCIITSTPGNDEDAFAQIWRGANNLFDDHGNEIPKGVGRNGFKSIKKIWSDHPRRDEAWEKAERAAMADDERFAREHMCEFISEDETLISPFTLARLVGKDPEFLTGTVRWYAKPVPNRNYLVSLDPSMGTGRDYAAIQVFQLPEMLQIAEWQHNKTDIPKQIKILREIVQYINECKNDGYRSSDGEIYWTVENNGVGEAALITIREISEESIGGTFISQPLGKSQTRRRKGFSMSNKMKLEACARFKSLLEKDKIHICSKALISQLKVFISRGASYAAKGSEHDDLVMSCLLIVKLLESVMSFEDVIREEFSESVDDDAGGDGSSRQPLWFV